MQSRPTLLILLLILFFPLAIGWMGCQEDANPPKSAPPVTAAVQDPGKQLHDLFCGTCHALPQPSDLDKKTWRDAVLVRMSAYMGIYNDNRQYYDQVPEQWLEPGIGGQRVLEAGIYPKQPLMNRQEWEQLRDYVLKNAPEHTFGPANALPITEGLPGFQAKIVRPDPVLQPLVCAVSIDPYRKGMYAAFFQQTLVHLNPKGGLLAQEKGLYGPVQIKVEKERISMAEIGSMKGSDDPKGQFMAFGSMTDLKKGRMQKKMEKLHRPVVSEYADLDGDGDEDLLICEFGYHLGALAWWENNGTEDWEKHILHPDDGAVAAGIHDFNGDGLPDILALMANSDESVRLYTNQGAGKFTEKRLFRFNPTYGSCAMELVDFDRDGDMDFIIANGDNGDYIPILKPNHGIRLYRNLAESSPDGNNPKFEEAFFLGMNGAYGTRTRDFDQDGDMDIAAVSFYPDYSQGGKEAFVYFEQTGQETFTARTLPEARLGRWMVLDAGDIDGDGDEDIVLGAFNVKSDDCSQETYDQWQRDDAPILILENGVK